MSHLTQSRAGLRARLLLYAAAPLALLAGAAAAQDESAPGQTAQPGGSAMVMEEMIVTARKREESVQDVPTAITAFSEADLKAKGIDSFDEVLDFVPNATQGGGIGGTVQGLISIRGISTLVRFVGVETGVGFYLDGVYTGRPENFNQDLIDIQRIEVLRGPQGTLFGRNNIAGAINLVTQQPTEELRGAVELQYGNFNLFRARAYLSGPIAGDVLTGSLSAGYTRRDGFVIHATDGPDLDTLDIATFRAKLRFQPTPDFDILLSADGLIDRGEPAFFEVSDTAFDGLFATIDPVTLETLETPFTTNQNQPNFLDRSIYGVSATINWDIGPGRLTAIGAYRDSSFEAGLDDDKTPFTFFVDFFGSDTSFGTAELRYTGSYADRLTYTAGFYYLTQDSDNFSPFALGDFLTGVPGLQLPITLTSGVETETFAGFITLDYLLTDRLEISVGSRYTSETRDAFHDQDDFTGIFGSTEIEARRTDDAFSPTVSLSYRATDDVLGYFRFARGFKSSGFNTDFIVQGGNFVADPEFATSYEVGVKGDFLGGRLRTNLAAFLTGYDDLQVSQITGFGVVLTNAADSEIWGVEGEFEALLHDYVSLNASFGYLDATYQDYPDCPVPGFTAATMDEPILANCAGNFLNVAPEWTAAVGAELNYPLTSFVDLVARLDYSFRGDIFFEPQNTKRLSGDSRNLLNLRAGFTTEHFEVFGWAENLLDEVYVTFADDRSAIAINTTQAFGAPRTFGITGRIKF